MNRQRTIPLLIVLFVATVLMLPSIAGAATSTRTLPASVMSGAEFTVSVSAADYGAIGSVVETIPAEFTYVSSTLPDEQVIVDGNIVTFNLMGESSFDYTVTASDTEGTYTFSGTIKDVGLTVFAIADSSIDVTAAAVVSASAERTMPASVEVGGTVTVGISAADYGAIGSVVETIPAEFTYVSSTLPDEQVIVDGNIVTFNLMGESSFDYTVTASDTEGTYTFSGLLKDEDLVESAITDSSINVASAPVIPASAGRTLPASVAPGEMFTVSITVANYGSIGSVVETIPAGFAYVSSPLDIAQVIVAGNLATFNLMGESSFDYTVTASDTDGTYTFSGVLKDEDLVESVIADSSIDVVTPPEDVPLQAGWNFISVPRELVDPSVEGVLAGVEYDALTYYNAQTRLWEAVSTFEPLKGYWINVSAADQVILEDSLVIEVSGATTPPSLLLYEGWNAIGSTDLITYSAEFVLQSIDDSYSKIIGPWNNRVYELTGLNGQSGDIGNGYVGTDIFEISPYSGYWVFVTEDCEMG